MALIDKLKMPSMSDILSGDELKKKLKPIAEKAKIASTPEGIQDQPTLADKLVQQKYEPIDIPATQAPQLTDIGEAYAPAQPTAYKPVTLGEAILPGAAAPSVGTSGLAESLKGTQTSLAGISSLAKKQQQAAPRTAPTVEAGEIAREDVADVSIDPVTGQIISTAGQEQFRTKQEELAKQLQDIAAGKEKTAAELQLQQALERGIKQTRAMQAGLSGPEAAAARRMATAQIAEMTQEAGKETAMMRLQEAANAREQLANIAATGRAADIDLASKQAELAQQAALASVDASLKTQLANQGIDLEVLKTNAAAGNQAALANLDSALTSMGMDDNMKKAYMDTQLRALGLEAETKMATAEMGLKERIAQAELQQQRDLTIAEMGNQAQMAKNEAIMQAQRLSAAAESEYNQGLITAQELQDRKTLARDQILADMYKFDKELETQARLQAQKLNAQSQSEYNQGLISEAELQTRIAIANAEADSAAYTARKQSEAAQAAGILGGLSTVGAAFITKGGSKAASDVNLKKNIKKSDKRIGEFLSKLNNYDYDYKDEKFGKGRHTSVMAQDLEKSEIGKKAVEETEDGKIVDYSKLLPEILASNVLLYKKVIKLEDALKARKKKNG